ncbi:MAG: 16S rRNA (guanine(966)-N(2))-methyltransferase RsmD [Nitrospirota bacterium]
MKVVSGISRGRRLKGSKAGIRPTSEKVKEALFDIIGEKVKGAIFLDLYAGTGAIGIEALSRGGEKAVFVESDPSLRRVIRENVSSLGLGEKADVVGQDAGRFLNNAMKKAERFDIIFLDPPYHTGEMDRIIKILSKGDVLNEDGVLVAEHFKKKKLPEEVGLLRLLKEYRYGDTVLTFYKIPLHPPFSKGDNIFPSLAKRG